MQPQTPSTNSGQAKNCQNCKTDFTIESEDFAFYDKIKVPPPSWCPECRLQRRFAHRNERSLYKNTCGLCKKPAISMFSPEKGLTTYCPACFFSDAWDATDHAQDYDFSISFFDQFIALQKNVPVISLLQMKAVDSPWVNYETESKNCYLNFGGSQNKDSAYNQYGLQAIDCFDNFWIFYGDFDYDNTICERVYQTTSSVLCFDCRDTHFSFDCRDCSNVIGCSGLRHKQYYIYNKQVSKEEYNAFVTENLNGSWEAREAVRQKAREIWRTTPQRATFIECSVNVSGNLIKDSKNCHACLSVEKCENCTHGVYVLEVNDSMDVTSAWAGDLMYEFIAGDHASNVRFSKNMLDTSSDLEYCNFLINSHHCFGCVGLRNKQYCILNKQYTKEEYGILVRKIREHMKEMPFIDRKGRAFTYGEFFPYEASPFSYEESVAAEWFPKTTEEIEREGLNGADGSQTGTYTFSDYAIPDNIADVTDEILEKTLKCSVSGKAYRIIPMELAFYRRFKIPIPRKAPFERHRERLRFIVDHRRGILRTCAKCHTEVSSVYSEEEFPRVYCHACHAQEVA